MNQSEIIITNIIGILQEVEVLNEEHNINESSLPEQDLAELGMDSLKTIEMIMRLEKIFNIEIDDEELVYGNFSNINNINEFVKTKLADQIAK